jgi:cytochrome c biogenesis protein CcdA/thiol-disulfide isomerase/thioredoxin/DsbC/DsbD-like thiol-disulfide interchange protein
MPIPAALRRRVAAAAALAIVTIAGAAIATGQRLDAPTATVTPLVESAPVRPGAAVRLALRVVVPDGYHLQADRPRDPSVIPTVLWIDPAAGVPVTEVVFPKATEFRVEGFADPLDVFEREFLIGVAASVPAGAADGPLTVPARLRYQACNDRQCLRPITVETGWTIAVRRGDSPGVPDPAAGASPALPDKTTAAAFGAIAFGTGRPPDPAATAPPVTRRPIGPGAAADALSGLDDFTIAGTAGGYLGTEDFLTFVRDAEAGVVQKSLFDDRGPLAILAIVYVGGLALNLTPCVLPMIPINLAIIGAGTEADRRRRGLVLGAAYGGAMAVAYGLLGLVVILTAGTFGALNSSPWFNLAIAVLFVVLGLAMFDVFAIDLSRLSSAIRFAEGSRGTVLLAFGMGAVAALLAGACVAPVVIQVVLFASDLYAKGTSLALALPFVLGLGMGLPWPIAGAGIASLPRPGRWMVRVKHVFGVFILGTALYYGYLAYTLFANRWVDPASVAASVEAQLKEGWYASLDAGLAAASAEGKPVLIDLWATWCKSCLTMDKTTLADPAVKAALAGYVKIKFQAEDLDSEPAASLMDRLDAVGLPAYAVLNVKVR